MENNAQSDDERYSFGRMSKDDFIDRLKDDGVIHQEELDDGILRVVECDCEDSWCPGWKIELKKE